MLTMLRVISLIFLLAGLSAFIASMDLLYDKSVNKPKSQYFGKYTDEILTISGFSLTISGAFMSLYVIKKINKSKNES